MASRKNAGRPARPVAAGNRWCGGCQAEHPVTNFTGNERSCRRAKYASHVRRAYGISMDQINGWRSATDGLCPICRLREGRYVDHDHETGQARGLLCQPCNTALGAFGEDPAVFHRALNYLKGHTMAVAFWAEVA